MSLTAPRTTIQLTPRDLQIILSVYRYDGMFSYQIRRRFWGQNGHPKTFLDRLSQLISAGFLRARPMDSATGRGTGQRLITLGRAAHPLLVELEGLTPAEIKRLRHSLVPPLWRHDAAVRDFRMSVELAAEAHSNVRAVDWINECQFKRQPIKVEVADPERPERLATVPLVPDGAFTLELVSGKSKQHYLEWDQDTESAPKIKGRVRAYLKYVGSSPTPVLWVVPSRERADKLSHWIQQEADSLQASPSIFAITTSDQVDERRILTHPIWQVVGFSEKRSLLPSSAQVRETVDGEPWYLKLEQEPAVA
jgi:hypothetical protein